jgi:CheY-like chemotaxis protein
MHKNMHIVLADDDTDDSELFFIVLKRIDPRLIITIVEDGVKLLQLLENYPLPALILLDLNMPRINGKQCIELIRSDKRYNDLPVIVLSTCMQLQVKYDCLALGANDYYVKPRSQVSTELLLCKIYQEQLVTKNKMANI